MPRRPAQHTQADYARFLRAAKQVGVPAVAVCWGNMRIIVPLNEQAVKSVQSSLPLLPPTSTLAESEDIVL